MKDVGTKHDHGKPDFDLVFKGFKKALLEVVKVGSYGKERYGPNNWKLVEGGLTRYSSAMLRHYFQEGYDDESGLLHAAHTAWNALAVLEFIIEDIENDSE